MKTLLISFALIFLFAIDAITQENQYNQLELLHAFDPGLSPTGRNGSYLGQEVTNIGDVNNDNFDDWAIGLPEAADIETSQPGGKVYIYFGSNSLIDEQDPDVILQGEFPTYSYGTCVSGAGDVNGDGFDDVIVGAYQDNDYGFVYIYYGGSTMDNEVDVIFTSDEKDDHFGYSVSGAGDLNNDGIDDVIIGTPEQDYDGAAFIYFGSDGSIDNTPDLTLLGHEYYSYFGKTVANAGDLNNDGYDDVAVYEKKYANGIWNEIGRVYIYNGGPNMDDTADVILIGELTTDFFGQYISTAGDVNGDDYDDLVVGSRGYPNDNKVYLYLGGAEMDSIYDLRIEGTWKSGLGQGGISSGNFNGDSYSDLFIYKYGNGLIFTGSETPDSVPDLTLNNIGTISLAGDINNDGYDDIIGGNPGSDINGPCSGQVLLFYGSPGIDGVADITMSGEQANDNFGRYVMSAGDVNGDGFQDVLISGLQNYLYYGGPAYDTIADVVFDGSTPSPIGDVNNDGYDDVILLSKIYFGGAPMDTTADLELGSSGKSAGDVNNDGFDDVMCRSAGDILIYFGGASMDNTIDVTITGQSADNFGTSHSSAGDVNNDGYDDVIIGAYGNDDNGLNTGKAYIYFGGDVMNTAFDVTLAESSQSQASFGYTVAAAGDVNNDGYDDVMVGAINDGEYQKGLVYVFYGGSTMDNDADVIIDGYVYDPVYDFGLYMDSIGDINNDGFGDILIGAQHTNVNSESETGTAYIFLGGSPMNNQVDARFTGEAYRNYFGCSVSSAGDFDDDGYNDIIIGAKGNSAVGKNMGRAYLYAGSKFPPNAPLDLEATPFADSVGLSWTPNLETNLSYYKIYRNIADSLHTADSVDRVLAPDTNYFDKGIVNGITYYYWISAVDVNGLEGPVWESASARPNTAPTWTLPDTIFILEDDTTYFDLNSWVYDSSDHDTTLTFQFSNTTYIYPYYYVNTHYGSISENIIGFSGRTNYVGSAVFKFTVRDIDNAQDIDSVVITVLNVNDPPVLDDLSNYNFTFEEDDSTFLLFSYFVSDIDNSISELAITAYAIESEAMNFNYNPETTYGYFVPLPDSNGVFTMVVTATDPDLAFDTDTVVFTVSPAIITKPASSG